MSGFRTEETRDKRLGRVCILTDEGARSEARIAVDRGANLFEFTLVGSASGDPLQILLGPGPGRDAMHFGIPILFPFPNRLRGGRFTFRGKTYQLDTTPAGNAIHGLVRGRKWKVESLGQTSQGASLTASFDSREHADVMRQFPFPFLLELEFYLRGKSLDFAAKATNVGDAPMPMGFGLHPWFRLPLRPGGDRRECQLQVPAPREWKLDRAKLPTGDIIDVPRPKDFRGSKPLGDLHLDDVYTDIESPGSCSYRDPGAGEDVVLRYGGAFRDLVIYAPRSTPALCIEPYTCPTDAFNLASRGIDAGVVVLESGGSWRADVEVEIVAR